jgi:hypothetical protein
MDDPGSHAGGFPDKAEAHLHWMQRHHGNNACIAAASQHITAALQPITAALH